MSDVSLLDHPSTARPVPHLPNLTADRTAQLIAMAGVRHMVAAIPDDASLAEPQQVQARLLSTATTAWAFEPQAATTAAETKALADQIQAAILSGSQASATPFDPLAPETATPLQVLLDTVLNGRTLAELEASPELLAAVRAAFQTEGGRQYAFDANIIDASLVGDLSQPLAAPGTAPVPRVLSEAELAAEVDATWARGPSVSPEAWAPARQRLLALAQHSPDVRNAMARARALNGGKAWVIELDASATGARLDTARGAIVLPSLADPQVAVSSIVFQANLVAPPAAAPAADDTSPRAAALWALGAEMLAGALRRDPAALNAYIDQAISQPDMTYGSLIDDLQDARALQPDWTFLQLRDYLTRQTRITLADRALSDPASLLVPYLNRTLDTPEKRLAFRTAVDNAHRAERTELRAASNHHLIFDTLLDHPAGAPALAGLPPATLQAMDRYREAPEVQRVVAEGYSAALDWQVRSGDAAAGLPPGALPVPVSTEVAPGGTTADDAVRTLFEAAGADAGIGARLRAEDAVASPTTSPREAAAREALLQAIKTESQALAERLVCSPELAQWVQALGPKAAAELVTSLATAIETDVVNGDRTGQATRTVLTAALQTTPAPAEPPAVVPRPGSLHREVYDALISTGMSVNDAATYAPTVGSLEILSPAFLDIIGQKVAGGTVAGEAILWGRFDGLATPEELADPVFMKHIAQAGNLGHGGLAHQALTYARGQMAAGIAPVEAPVASALDIEAAFAQAVNGFVGSLFDGVRRFELPATPGEEIDGLGDQPVNALIDRLIAATRPMPARGDMGNLLAQPENSAARVIKKAGSTDGNDSVTASELRAGLQATDYLVDLSDDALEGLVNAYSQARNGSLSQADLAAAIRDQALVVQADGRVTLDPARYGAGSGALG